MTVEASVALTVILDPTIVVVRTIGYYTPTMFWTRGGVPSLRSWHAAVVCKARKGLKFVKLFPVSTG